MEYKNYPNNSIAAYFYALLNKLLRLVTLLPFSGSTARIYSDDLDNECETSQNYTMSPETKIKYIAVRLNKNTC